MFQGKFSLVSAFFCLFFIFFSLPAQAASEPKLKSGALLYERSDREFVSAVVMDAASGKILYSYQPNKVWPAASLSKLMAALVTIEHHKPWDTIVATAKSDEVGGGSLVVPVGSKMSVKDMLYSSIVGSANNTTMSLARLSGLGTKGFVNHMNATAKKLGLKYTKFVEPTGLSEKNVTTAREMAKIADEAFSWKLIRDAASTKAYSFSIRNRTIKKTVKNTNHLLTTDSGVNVLGGKTGFIYEADYNFALKAADTSGGRKLIVVVLGSPTKEGSFNAGRSLANWAWRAYAWPSGNTLASVAK